jgi:hypothetical protein
VCVCVCVCVRVCVPLSRAADWCLQLTACVLPHAHRTHTSHLTPHTSHLTPHTPHATRHASQVTHNYAIGSRSQLLDFEVVPQQSNVTHGVLRVRAPPAPEFAPPSHYMLYLLRGETYSPQAAWVQLRRAPAALVPMDFPQESRCVCVSVCD